MILSDNETKVDMLNNKAIAKTVADVIRECDNRPISIGIHGDWGAGKSSILLMVKDELESKTDKDNGIVCIRFNGWQHQGFEDAKIALMSAIVSELENHEKVTVKAKATIKKLWKNINWFSVAKTVGSAVFSLSTGLPPIGFIDSLANSLKTSVSDKEKVDAAIESIGKYLTDSKVFEDVSLTKEFAEFQKSFESFLDETNIKKLIVLIDDLDRCLPKVTIETMEAIRLFMFTNKTAFVIAADEAMIEYAVHNHFPNLPDEMKGSYDYSRRYLEKLIQVPFKIPTLGEIESEIYITLLMIGSQIKEDDKDFNELLTITIEKMKKPWDNAGLSYEDLQKALKENYDKVNDEITVANQISGLLASNTQGNPRKIKRFLNMLLLRKKMAEARGFGDAVLIPVLAKLMLAEYYFSDQYKEIAALTDDNGKCLILHEFEKSLSIAEADTETDESDATADVDHEAQTAEDKSTDSKIEEWKGIKDFPKWVACEPNLGEIDLRPYFFASKEREDFFFEQIKSERLRELVSILMSKKMVIATMIDEIKNLTSDEAKLVYDLLTIKTKKTTSISTQPSGIDGIRILVEHHKELERNLVGFVESFSITRVGGWICTGWEKSITTEPYKAKLREYIRKLKMEGDNFTKAAAAAALN